MTTEGIISLDHYLLTLISGSHSLFLDSMVPMLTSGLTWIPLYIGLLYIVVKNNETMSQIGLIIASAVMCVVLCGGVDDFIVKPLVGRLRPCNDPAIMGVIYVLPQTFECSYSFFSAHAANTMSLAVFFIFLVRDRLFATAMIVWSLVNCWTRLYLGVHYPTDVAVGVLYGATMGSLVYFIFLKIYFKFNIKFHYISSQYTSTGYDKSDTDVVIAILVITVAVLMLGALAGLMI